MYWLPEIDKYAIQVYSHHFHYANYGDATTIDTGTLPDFDLLVGGFPCQLSALLEKGEALTKQEELSFLKSHGVLRDKRPRHFLLENVKGLLSHDSGKTFSTILGVLTDLGYFVEWEVLNSKDLRGSQTESGCSLSDILEDSLTKSISSQKK